MPKFKKGRYKARITDQPEDILAAQQLRHRCFHPDAEPGIDSDAFDLLCQHILLEDTKNAELVCCFRLLPIGGGGEIEKTYSAQFYELSGLQAFDGPMVEMGRFCIAPEATDPDILRVAWAAMTQYVDAEGVEMLFGCSSFKGTESAAYLDAFALLKEHHLAPKRWLPKVKAPNVFRFARSLRRTPDVRRAMLGMPPLLRSYLVMGGWVSDHAVVDRDMNTLHVFTGLEIKSIPATRKRLLRTAAG